MAGVVPSFTVGIEEEYLLVDRASRDVALEPPREILERCHGHRFLPSQESAWGWI